MTNPNTAPSMLYPELAEQVGLAARAWKATAAAAFDGLRTADQELAQLALEVLGTQELAEQYFAKAHGRYARANCYAMLAAGERETIVTALTAAAYGMYT